MPLQFNKRRILGPLGHFPAYCGGRCDQEVSASSTAIEKPQSATSGVSSSGSRVKTIVEKREAVGASVHPVFRNGGKIERNFP